MQHTHLLLDRVTCFDTCSIGGVVMASASLTAEIARYKQLWSGVVLLAPQFVASLIIN